MLISAKGREVFLFFSSFVYFVLFVVILTALFRFICSYLEVLAIYEPRFAAGCDKNVIDLWA
ncbi:MAG: putative membrane protein YkvI [Kiritimatiellia bacterium]|jgi:uncharacterized membrane protein YkvI